MYKDKIGSNKHIAKLLQRKKKNVLPKEEI